MRQMRRPREFSNRLPGNLGTTFVSELKDLLWSIDDDGKTQYLRSECFSKYCDSSTVSPEVRRRAAIDKWLSTEQRNLKSNLRLSHAEAIDLDLSWTTWRHLRDDIRQIVKSVLGPITNDTLSTGNHTNGASTRIKRSPKAAIDKFTGEAHITAAAVEHWSNAMGDTLAGDQNLQLSLSSVLFTVPKSTDIDRVACKEPEINMFLQRSVGNHIRQRLRFVGIDLNDQSKNRNLARQAVSLGLATIDLSSASDSISKGLAFSLLPFEWWSLLSDLRVESTTILDYPTKGCVLEHRLEMFSSMGNGFTFELESLLFYAITRAVCRLSKVRGKISVYGDDIIAPCTIVPRLKRVFDLLGLKLNLKKTHWRGWFRESCGGHYYRGVDITPFYIKGPVGMYTDLIRVLNQLLEWDGRGWGFFTTPAIALFHKRWSAKIPACLHGGNDLESNSSLVTGNSPRSRLTMKKKQLSFDQYAGYLYWHTSRNLSVVPIGCEVHAEIALVIRRFPAYTERTTWTPYIAISDEVVR